MTFGLRLITLLTEHNYDACFCRYGFPDRSSWVTPVRFTIYFLRSIFSRIYHRCMITCGISLVTQLTEHNFDAFFCCNGLPDRFSLVTPVCSLQYISCAQYGLPLVTLLTEYNYDACFCCNGLSYRSSWVTPGRFTIYFLRSIFSRIYWRCMTTCVLSLVTLLTDYYYDAYFCCNGLPDRSSWVTPVRFTVYFLRSIFHGYIIVAWQLVVSHWLNIILMHVFVVMGYQTGPAGSHLQCGLQYLSCAQYFMDISSLHDDLTEHNFDACFCCNVLPDRSSWVTPVRFTIYFPR